MISTADQEAASNHNAALYKDPNDPAANTNFYVDGAINVYTNEGVPVDKLVLGVPFYGRGWKSCGKENNGQYQPCKPGSDGKLASLKGLGMIILPVTQVCMITVI